MDIDGDSVWFCGATRGTNNTGEIIGIGIQVVDNDLGPDADDPRTAKWALGGQPCINGDGACGSDYILLPIQADLLPTAVEDNSWGHIKASFGQ